MRKFLTDRGVAALKPRARRYAHPDPQLSGHVIRVQPTGSKSFVAVTDHSNGKQHWVTIGSAAVLGIEQARDRARTIIDRVRRGLPAIEPQGETFGAVVELWRRRHVEANGLRSAAQINRLLNVHVLPTWRDRPLVGIRRSDIAALLDKIEDAHGARQADLVLTIVRAILNWYATRQDDYSPPIARGMRRQSTHAQARAQLLDDEEIRAIWAAGRGTTFSSVVRMCLLTAQRSRKISSMRWVDYAEGIWTVPTAAREKDAGGVLVLPAAARAIVAAQPRLASNPHVFASVRGNGPYCGFSAGKAAFDAKLPAGMAPWTIHDLRRTARSLMARAGVPSEHAERTLGHAIAGVAGVYDRHSYAAEKGAALAKLANLIDDIVHPRDNVLPLASPKRRKRHVQAAGPYR